MSPTVTCIFIEKSIIESPKEAADIPFKKMFKKIKLIDCLKNIKMILK